MSTDEAVYRGQGLQPQLAWPLLRMAEDWLPPPPSPSFLEVATTPAAGLLEFTDTHTTGRLFLRLVETFQGIQLSDATAEPLIGQAADVALMLETWRIPAARWIAWSDHNWRSFAPEEMRGNRAPLRHFMAKKKLITCRKELPVDGAIFCGARAWFAPEAIKLLARYKAMQHDLLRVPADGRRHLFNRYFRGYPGGLWERLVTASRTEHRLYAGRVAAKIAAGEYVW